MKATWNGKILAQSPNTLIVEGNHYFPPNSINTEYFKEIEKTTLCPWKGKASYYDIEVNGKINQGAAWTYHEPKEKAMEIKDYVAFWNGVKIEE